MAAIVTPYASGTITSITGTTVVISGGAVAGWVGRAIRLTTGTGKGQTRRITAYVSATQITIDFAFANTFTSGVLAGLVDVDPVAADGFVVSHAPADIQDGTSIIVDLGTNRLRFVGASSFAGGAFLYLANWQVELTSTTLTTTSATQADRCAWRLGDVDSVGNFYNGCTLLDLATAASGWNPTASIGMDFEFYGGLIRCTGAAPFWRFHTDDDERARICGVRVNGNIGGRMQGARSVNGDWEVYGNTSASGPFNAKSAFGRITGIKVSQSLQSVYHYWPDSQTLTIEGIQLGPNVTRGIRFANINTTGKRLTLRDIDIASWSALPSLYQNDAGTYANDFRISQFVGGSYRNVAGAVVTDSTRFVLRDNVPATTYNATVTDGLLPQQEVRYRDMVVQTAGGFTWASAGGTTFAPYVLAAISYLYQPATAVMPLLVSTSPSLLALPDTYVTQTNKATVDAYTTIDNLDQLYDRCKSWTVGNLDLANPSFGAQLATGNGTELDLGAFNLTIDGTATSAFAVVGPTITIKSSALGNGANLASLATTGTVSLVNGGTISASKYTDSTCVNVGVSVTGLIAGSRIQIYNVTDATETDNQIVAGTSFFRYGTYTVDKTYRLRVTQISGVTCYDEYEASGTFGSSGITFQVSQVPCIVYNANGTDGSTVPEFTADYPTVHVDITDPDGVTTLDRLYAWFHYTITTADGIRNFFGGIAATDTSNYVIRASVIDLKLDNTSVTPVKIMGGYLSRDDGATVIAATSGSIQMDPSKAYIANSASITASLARIEPNTGLIPALL
jgi:hypothetical protein